ncbi:MAG: M15 family metallopeptidase [Acidimicrobiales bacterium]
MGQPSTQRRTLLPLAALALAAATAVVGCGGGGTVGAVGAVGQVTSPPGTVHTDGAGSSVATSPTTAGAGGNGSTLTDGSTPTDGSNPTDGDARARPDWLGTRPLTTLEDGSVPPQTTPPELVDRNLITVDTLPPPTVDEFTATVAPLTGDPLDRSTWSARCPVASDELSYITMTFWGFDNRSHTGEMIVNVAVADDVVDVFRKLYEARFPIEEMRIVTPEDLAAPPLGDGNNTTSFSCRAVVGTTSTFSQHAHGLAVDINPFHNPYHKGDVVLPELATVYLDRSPGDKGVITEGDLVTTAFDEIGWGWGGRWETLKDFQHFSFNNR